MKFHRASESQLRAAKRFASESKTLTYSQAVKNLDDCFAVLEYARENGLTFGEVWDTEELHSAALEAKNA